MRHKRAMTEREYEQWRRTRERARAGMSYGGRPTLKSQRDYYRQMADDPDTPVEDRDTWALLADELTQRLGDSEAAGQAQEQLPFG